MVLSEKTPITPSSVLDHLTVDKDRYTGVYFKRKWRFWTFSCPRVLPYACPSRGDRARRPRNTIGSTHLSTPHGAESVFCFAPGRSQSMLDRQLKLAIDPSEVKQVLKKEMGNQSFAVALRRSARKVNSFIFMAVPACTLLAFGRLPSLISHSERQI